ncbi:hypothetical protein PAL_GLEAN10020913 [Pteropus alecto]|uniref:Uncharacterized protein n=1 Tax=Pteropus alecto TaxID=9402 RepID=L5JPE8_PTEAL|nr:hypothetical protein PAL_GLEAN10020913 [Pteropus alecto]
MLSPAPNPEAQSHGIFVLCQARCWARSGSHNRGISGICGGMCGSQGLPPTLHQRRPSRLSVPHHSQSESKQQSIYFLNKHELKWCTPKWGAGPSCLGAGGLGPRVQGARPEGSVAPPCSERLSSAYCISGETTAVAAEQTGLRPRRPALLASRAKRSSPGRGGHCSLLLQAGLGPWEPRKGPALPCTVWCLG